MPPAQSQAVSSSSSSSQQLALGAGLLVVAVWGANFTVQKALFEVLPPGAFLFARYLLMPLCAALLLMHANGRRWLRLPRGTQRDRGVGQLGGGEALAGGEPRDHAGN